MEKVIQCFILWNTPLGGVLRPRWFCLLLLHLETLVVRLVFPGEIYKSRPFIEIGMWRWKDINNILNPYTRSDRHKDSAVSQTKFKAIQIKEMQPFVLVLMTGRNIEIKEKREHVKALLEITALLGRLGTTF